MTAIKTLLITACLLASITPARAGVTMVVSQKSGATVIDQATRLAGRLGGELKTAVNLTKLSDLAEVEAWLNRYATADLALVETDFAAAKPGHFMVFGSVAPGLILIGRQGLPGDLPVKIEAALKGGGGSRSLTGSSKAVAHEVKPQRPQAAAPPTPKTALPDESDFSSSKSVEEDRFFVIDIYREKFGKEPNPERLEYWTGQLQSGVISKQQLSTQLCQQGMALCTTKR